MAFIGRKRQRGEGQQFDPAQLQALVSAAAVPMAVLRLDGEVIAANETLTSLLSTVNTAGEQLALNSSLHPDDVSLWRQQLSALVDSHQERVCVPVRLTTAPGAGQSYLLHACRLDEGYPLILVTVEDRTEWAAREAEDKELRCAAALQQRMLSVLAAGCSEEALLTGLVASVGQAWNWQTAVVWSVEGEVLRYLQGWHDGSDGARLYLDSARDNAPTPSMLPYAALKRGHAVWLDDLLTADNSAYVRRAHAAGFRSAAAFPLPTFSAVLELHSAEPRPVSERLTASILTLDAAAREAQSRLEGEEPLRAREAYFRALTEGANDAIVTIDEESRIEFANAAVKTIFGYAPTELVGEYLAVLMPENMWHAHQRGMSHYLQSGRRRIGWEHLEIVGRHKDGRDLSLQLSLAEIDRNGCRSFAGFMRDITVQKKEESALVYQALHDSLTDLPNRGLLQERVNRALLVGQRHSQQLALLFMDLDRFKDINDSFGHEYGDRLLQEVARRLVRTLRESDTVARLGGDEFAILLPYTDTEGAVLAAERILDAIRTSFRFEGNEFEINASIGITISPDHGTDCSVLMRRADMAMYAAKRGATGFAVYSPERDEVSARRLLLMNELANAVRTDQLVLHYQPKVDLISGRTEHVEALVRWQHPLRGLVPPDEFIPATEETDLARKLTDWVLRSALRQHVAWRNLGIDLSVAVNFSARVLHDRDLVASVSGLLAELGVDPSRLTIEITESAIMIDPEWARETLSALHRTGIRTSIDDFGTGHSSLAYLRRLPFDEIKIDKSFVLDLATSRDDASIVRSVIALGHNFDLKVVAEGVDNRRSLDMLGSMGCDLAQGFHLSRPLSADQLTVWLADRGGPLVAAS